MQHLTTKKVIASIIQKDSKVLIAQRAKKDSLYGKGYKKYTQEDLLPEKIKNKRYLEI